LKIKKAGVEKISDPGFGMVLIQLCDAFTSVRIPPKVFHIIQKRHAVTGLFWPSGREKTPDFRGFFGVTSFLESKPGGDGGNRTRVRKRITKAFYERSFCFKVPASSRPKAGWRFW